MTDLPDWYEQVAPMKTTLGPNQARYMISSAGNVAGGGTGTLSIGVPTTHNLYVNAITVASPVSCINYMNIIIGGTTYYWKYWDTNGDVFFPEGAAPQVPAGTNVTITVHNNDAAQQELRVCVAGTYEQI